MLMPRTPIPFCNNLYLKAIQKDTPTFLQNRCRLIIAVFCSLLSALPAFSQTPVYKRYTVEDGLPSSEVYDIHQDRRGYMWIATDHGLCRFDGYKFVTYTTSDGLADNVVFRVIEDRRGRIWLPTISRGLCFYEDGKFKQHPLNDRIIKEAKGSWINAICIDSKDTIWYSYRDVPRKIFKLTPDGKMLVDTMGQLPRDHDLAYARQVESNCFICGAAKFDDSKKNKPFESWFRNDLFIISTENTGIVDCITAPDGSALCSFGNSVIRYKQSVLQSVSTFTNKVVTDLYQDKAGHLWAGTLGAGVFLFEDGNPDSRPLNFFPDKSISHVTQDSEGGYWFSTLEDGVYYVPFIEFKRLAFRTDDNDDRITDISAGKDGLLFSTYRGNLFKVDDKLQPREIIYNAEPVHIDNILRHSNGHIYLSNHFEIEPSGKKKPMKFYLGNTKVMMETNEGEIVLAGTNGFKIFKDEKLVLNSADIDFRERVAALHGFKNGAIWFGTLNGLFELKDRKMEFLGNRHPLLSNRITCISEGTHNTILLGTRGAGLLIKKGDSLTQFTQKQGLLSDLIISMTLQNDSVLWIGTNKGLNRIFLDASGFPRSTENYSVKDGLPSNEINRIVIYNGLLWVGTNQGITYFDPGRIVAKHTAPAVYITRVRINDEDTSVHAMYNLDADQRDLIISFFGISFRSLVNTRYRYKMEGLHNDWIETSDLSVQYTSLPAGKYTFLVEAMNKDGQWNGQPASIIFNIDKHFYKTWWFILLVLLGAISLTVLISSLVIRYNKRKQEIETKIIQSEQKALRSQMNPHFIFNAMNSIQYFIAENDKKKAVVYLAKFSFLVRRIIENSKKNVVNLEEEIANAQLYLELEKLRFGDKFDFTVEVDENINPSELNIPTMLLQPYLENAIWHGIMPKEEKGLVSLKIQLVEGDLVCTIEDNGIGRDKVREMSRRKNLDTSGGMKNILERIELMNAMYKTNLSLEVVDLYSDNKEALGTRVLITIPSFRWSWQ
jgi:ligand-binding sensor domain-containing protein